MQSVSLKTDKPLNPDKFFPWIQKLVAGSEQRLFEAVNAQTRAATEKEAVIQRLLARP